MSKTKNRKSDLVITQAEPPSGIDAHPRQRNSIVWRPATVTSP